MPRKPLAAASERANLSPGDHLRTSNEGLDEARARAEGGPAREKRAGNPKPKR